MKRPSLYAAFGDKRELYLAARDRCVEVADAARAETLSEEQPRASGLQDPPLLAGLAGAMLYAIAPRARAGDTRAS